MQLWNELSCCIAEVIIPFFCTPIIQLIPFITKIFVSERGREGERAGAKGRKKSELKRKENKNTTAKHFADAIDHQIRSECQNGLLTFIAAKWKRKMMYFYDGMIEDGHLRARPIIPLHAQLKCVYWHDILTMLTDQSSSHNQYFIFTTAPCNLMRF